MVAPLQHPRERITCIREPIQPDGLAPIKVLQRSDGRYIVYDPALPLGQRTASVHDDYDSTVTAAWARRKRAT